MIDYRDSDEGCTHKLSNSDLVCAQMKMLKDFLERGAITRAQYDHSTKVLIEKIPHGERCRFF